MEQIHAYACRRIKEEIPREILEGTFIRRDLRRELFEHISLDAAIKTAVLDGGLYLDIQLITGRETNIDLSGLELLPNVDGSVTVQVPLSRTGGRTILEVFRVGFQGQSTSTNYNSSSNVSEVDIRVDALLAGVGSIPVTSTTDCEMIAPNVILVNLGGTIPSFLNAQVNLNVSLEMSHIPAKAYHKFGELCVERCKQYIYNHHRVKLDRGMIERGMELGAYNEEIQEYRDSGKNYRDLLKSWRRTEFHLDIEKKTKFIRAITPSLL